MHDDIMHDDELTSAVYQQSPYNTRGARTTFNANDGIYGQSDGQTLMAVSETDDGYEAAFNIALDV